MSEVKQLQTLEEATRYAYGLKETIKELDEYKRIAEMEIQKWEEKIKEVNQWLEDVSKPINERINYFQILLVDYHRRTFLEANEKEQNKLKSIKLPYGITLKSTAQQPKLHIHDAEKYKEYAVRNNLVKVEPIWASVKENLMIVDDKVVDNCGEIIDFIKVEPADRKFDIKCE